MPAFVRLLILLDQQLVLHHRHFLQVEHCRFLLFHQSQMQTQIHHQNQTQNQPQNQIQNQTHNQPLNHFHYQQKLLLHVIIVKFGRNYLIKI